MHVNHLLLPNPLGNSNDAIMRTSFGPRFFNFNDWALRTGTKGDILYCSANHVWNKLAIGSTGQVLNVSSGLPSWGQAFGHPRGVYGFFLRALGNFTGTMDVYNPSVKGFSSNLSWCRDSTNTATLTFVGTTGTDYSTISLSVEGIKGVGTWTGNGTATSNTGSATVTGSGSAFLTDFGTRAATGTCTSSGTAVTGTGTRFLVEFAIGDLLGNATNGYAIVASIASDTSITLGASIPGGNLSSASVNVIENPTISVGSKKFSQVLSITSNTTLTVTSTEAVTQTGTSWRGGGVPTAGATYPATNFIWMYVWVGSGGTGTDVFLSTQRTIPNSGEAVGYNTYRRRIGCALVNTSSVYFVPFEQREFSNTRVYQYEVAIVVTNTRILTGGTATSWTRISAAAIAPPSATALFLNLYGGAGSNGGVRRSGAGDTTTGYRSHGIITNTGTFNSTVIACDESQCIDYSNNNGGGGSYIDVGGYIEEI